MSFDEMMKELKQEYLEALPQRILNLRQWIQTGEVSLLINEFHKFKGTGTTYGLPEISELGSTMERLLAELEANEALVKSQTGVDILEQIFSQRQRGFELNLEEHMGYKELKESLAHDDEQ